MKELDLQSIAKTLGNYGLELAKTPWGFGLVLIGIGALLKNTRTPAFTTRTWVPYTNYTPVPGSPTGEWKTVYTPEKPGFDISLVGSIYGEQGPSGLSLSLQQLWTGIFGVQFDNKANFLWLSDALIFAGLGLIGSSAASKLVDFLKK